jgi:histidinol dehydrogenase
MKISQWSSLSRAEQQALLQRPVQNLAGQIKATQAIIDEVREHDDQALLRLTEKYDGCTPASLQVDIQEIKRAVDNIHGEVRDAIADAATRIRAFHKSDMPQDKDIETAPGLTCSVRYQALDAVGLYVPGGSAPLISTILMLAIPATLAGCENLVLCTPPDADGRVPAEMLAAAHYCGVEQVFCVGGAQAIAAMAYGTASVPRVCKIFGPGNSWVTTAKQLVSEDSSACAIDMPAGPSEIAIIADADANPEFVAWDLLAQAEHGPDSQSLLLTDSDELALAVYRCIQSITPDLPRANILARSLDSARLIVVNSIADAVKISNEYAPEHLIINTNDPGQIAREIRNAGSVFLGAWTPVTLGDYCSGTNHVLPTNGWARSYGALGVADFMRRMTLQEASYEALAVVGPTAELLSEVEGLDAHGMAVRCRLGVE